MKTYWVVVHRMNRELYRALALGFYQRAGFHVIANRRSGIERSARRREERRAPETLGTDDFLVVEQVGNQPDSLRRRSPSSPV